MLYRCVEKEVGLLKMLRYEYLPKIKIEMRGEVRKLKKGALKKSIDALHETRARYFSWLYEGNRESGGNFYWFELTRYQPLEWRISRLLPAPPPLVPPAAILPRDIIHRITDSLINPDESVTMTVVPAVPLKYKTVELCFIHYSSNYIFGRITLK